MSWLSALLNSFEREARPVVAPIAAEAAPVLEEAFAEELAGQHLKVLQAVSGGLEKLGVPAELQLPIVNIVGTELDKVAVPVQAAASSLEGALPLGQQAEGQAT